MVVIIECGCGILSHCLVLEVRIGPSEVCALPLGVAAEQSVHYFWEYFSFFLLCHLLFSQKGLSYGYETFYGVLSHKNSC